MKNITARCLLCNEILRSYSDDTSNLIEHLRIKHPDINLHSLDSSNATLKKNDSEIRMIESSKLKSKGTFEEINEKQLEIKLQNPKEKFIKQFSKSNGNNISSNSICKCKLIDCCDVGPQISRRDLISSFSAYDSYDKLYKEIQQKKIDEIATNNKQSQKLQKQYIDKAIQISEESKLSESTPSLVEKKNRRNTKEPHKHKYVPKNSLTKNSFNKKIYKTSIEKWRPGRNTICCPCCGQFNIPVVRNRIDKITSNSINAACILSCWPLCFLPCSAISKNKEYLYCSICYYFLGIYDHKTEMILAITETHNKKFQGHKNLLSSY